MAARYPTVSREGIFFRALEDTIVAGIPLDAQARASSLLTGLCCAAVATVTQSNIRGSKTRLWWEFLLTRPVCLQDYDAATVTVTQSKKTVTILPLLVCLCCCRTGERKAAGCLGVHLQTVTSPSVDDRKKYRTQ